MTEIIASIESPSERLRAYVITFWRDTPDGVIEVRAQEKGFGIRDTRKGKISIIGPKTRLIRFLSHLPQEAHSLFHSFMPHPRPDVVADLPCLQTRKTPVDPGLQQAIDEALAAAPRIRTAICTRTPLPTLPLPQHKTTDLTGYRHGKLVVVGYLGEGDRWVVRCDCGNYTVRRSKTLKPDNKTPHCPECHEIEYQIWLAAQQGESKGN